MAFLKTFLQVSSLVGALTSASGCQKTNFTKTPDGGFELTVESRFSDASKVFDYVPASKEFPEQICLLGDTAVDLGNVSAELVIGDSLCNKEVDVVALKYKGSPEIGLYVLNKVTKRLENANPKNPSLVDPVELTTKVNQMLADFCKENGIERLIGETKK